MTKKVFIIKFEILKYFENENIIKYWLIKILVGEKQAKIPREKQDSLLRGMLDNAGALRSKRCFPLWLLN